MTPQQLARLQQAGVSTRPGNSQGIVFSYTDADGDVYEYSAREGEAPELFLEGLASKLKQKKDNLPDDPDSSRWWSAWETADSEFKRIKSLVYTLRNG
jgi:hypothetical protein